MKTLTKKQKTVILTNKNVVSKSIINAINNCTIKDGKIYHTYTSGSGRFISNYSARVTIIAILNASNYNFTEGNDSARGGKCGDYIKASKTAIDFIINLTK